MSQGFAATMQEQLVEGGRCLVCDGDLIEVPCHGGIVEGIEVVATDCDMGLVANYQQMHTYIHVSSANNTKRGKCCVSLAKLLRLQSKTLCRNRCSRVSWANASLPS